MGVVGRSVFQCGVHVCIREGVLFRLPFDRAVSLLLIFFLPSQATVKKLIARAKISPTTFPEPVQGRRKLDTGNGFIIPRVEQDDQSLRKSFFFSLLASFLHPALFFLLPLMKMFLHYRSTARAKIYLNVT